MVGFKDDIAEFSPNFIGLKDLAEELCDVLFHSKELAPFTGTYKDRSIMDDGMLNAFNKKIYQIEENLRVTLSTFSFCFVHYTLLVD